MKRQLIAATILASSLTSYGVADLLSRNDMFHGPSSITVDTESGLEWLDVPRSRNLSPDHIRLQLGTGGQFGGLRYRTIGEVTKLFENAGIPDPSPGSGARDANFEPVTRLMALIGVTAQGPEFSPTIGILGEPSPLDPEKLAVAHLESNPTARVGTANPVGGTATSSLTVGSFPVRNGASNSYNLPQVANGGGLIRTTFIAFNNGDVMANVALTLRDDNGNPLPLQISDLGTDSVHVFMLRPGETRFLETTGQGPIQVGSAQAVSTAPIGFSGVFSLMRRDGGTLTEAGVGASEGLTEFWIAADSTGVFNTGVALQNLAGGSNKVVFTFFEAQPTGSAAPSGGLETTRTLGAKGHLSVFFSGADGLFPAIGATRGVLRVRAESEVAALTLRQGRSGSPLTTLPVVSSTSHKASFVLPQVANGAGIRTQFILFGLGIGLANVNLTLTDSEGAAFPVTLSNGESGSSFGLTVGGTEALFLETDGRGVPRAGAARVISDVPIGLTAAFSLLNAQGQITTEAGIGSSPALEEFSLPVDLTADLDTGLALFNPGNATANLTLRFIANDGTTTEAEISLEAGSGNWIAPQGTDLSLAPFNQLARFVSQLITGLHAERGQLAVSSDRPINALTLRQGPATLTTLAVEPGIAAGARPRDTDRDGLSDDIERSLGTAPDNVDSDCDGVSDGDEVVDAASPADSDGDTLIDALESRLVDSDLDGTTDQFDPDTEYSISCGLFVPYAVANDGMSSTQLEVRIHGPAPTRVLVRDSGLAGTPLRGYSDVFVDGVPLSMQDIELFDDGTHGDREAGDNVFSRAGITSTASSGSVTDRDFDEVEIFHDGGTTLFRGFRAGGFFGVSFLGVVEAAKVATPNVIGPDLQTTSHLVNLISPLDSLDVKRFLMGEIQQMPLATLSRLHYTVFEDVFDLLMFFPESPATGGAFGRLLQIRNDVAGIGLDHFDNSAFYGSTGRLQAVGARNYSNNGPTLHEWAHRWAVFLNTSLGFPDTAHWGFSGTGRGQLGGFDPETLVDNMDGTYTVGEFGTFANGGDSVPYSKIELYLAGLAGAEEVGDIPVALNPRNISCIALRLRRTCTFEADGIRTVTIDDIIEEHGARLPAAGDAQTAFRTAFIVASQRPLTAAEMAYYNVQAVLFGAEKGSRGLLSFEEATLGRATMDTSIPAHIGPSNTAMDLPGGGWEDALASDNGAAPPQWFPRIPSPAVPFAECGSAAVRGPRK